MRVSSTASWLRLALLLAVVVAVAGLLAPPAQAAYPNCNQICNYSPPSTNCTCWFPGGYYHPGCAQYQITGCFPGRSAPMMSPSVLNMSSLDFASPELSEANFLHQLEEGLSVANDAEVSEDDRVPAAEAVKHEAQGAAAAADAARR